MRTAFAVAVDRSDSVSLVLAEVQDKTPPGFDSRQFSLIFEGPTNWLLPQRIYVLDHAVLGRFELFLVPIGRRESSVLYEAFFSQMTR